MISIDRFEEILSDLAEEIPQSFYEELNGGIVVEPIFCTRRTATARCM